MSMRHEPWDAGVPCWADLATPHVSAIQDFYADVLGWTFREPAPDFGGYVMAETGGAVAAGLGALPEPGMASAWTLYLASDDADRTAAAVARHGGSVVVSPTDVGPMGRMLIAVDPTGAAFGVWQAGAVIGAEIVNEPGGLAWEDLRSADPDPARAFYTAVFGYETRPLPAAGPDYTTFHQPGDQAPLGGMGSTMGAAEDPSHWLVYFGVADADASVAAAQRHGGTVTTEPFDTPFGRMAGLRDPAGALFWIAQAPGADPRG